MLFDSLFILLVQAFLFMMDRTEQAQAQAAEKLLKAMNERKQQLKAGRNSF